MLRRSAAGHLSVHDTRARDPDARLAYYIYCYARITLATAVSTHNEGPTANMPQNLTHNSF
jgi:hypothetical protein